ncbi:hypothetical protein BH09ACT8_BH09ACT8_32760 [soil metagenome]
MLDDRVLGRYFLRDADPQTLSVRIPADIVAEYLALPVPAGRPAGGLLIGRARRRCTAVAVTAALAILG